MNCAALTTFTGRTVLVDAESPLDHIFFPDSGVVSVMAVYSDIVSPSPISRSAQRPPVMDSQQMQEWLNRMDDYGWEFVGYGATHWRGYSVPQEWWIFRRPVQS